MKFKVLFAIVLLAALGWAGWWWFGASAQERLFAQWLADRREEGWQAEADAIATRGFPNRFDTRIDGLTLADPDQGWAWRAPRLDILMLSYAPNKAILQFPPEQALSAPGERATLRSEGLRASARLIPGPALELSRLSVESGPATLAGAAGWTASAQGLQLHVLEAEEGTGPDHSYRLYGELTGLRPPQELAEAVLEGLPATLETLKFDGRAAFDAPFDRRAVEDRQPRLELLSIEAMEARWGKLFLAAKGVLKVDDAGYPVGRLDLSARNWRAMLSALTGAGAIGRNAAGAAEMALSLLGGLSGDGAVSAPLSFRDGRMLLGPVPIGDAPRLAKPK